jgi:transposase
MKGKDKRPFALSSERLGPLPIVNRFMEQAGVEKIFDSFVPTTDKRCRLPYAKGLAVLLRSIIVEREPIYRHGEVVSGFTPTGFGLTKEEAEHLKDDQLGRALDHLFLADRGTLLTQIVVEVTRRFDVRLDELHNDSTTVKFTGQYRDARGRRIRGKRAPCIIYGHSKDHRPDLKQLLFILTTSTDGGIPVQFRCEDGNTNDSVTHIETWETLREASGKTDFLYVADCKLCSFDNMKHIHSRKGRFVTVMPRSRKEDKAFRKWAQDHEVPWEKVWDRPNPRRKHGPRDRWYVYRRDLPSAEGWPVTWVYSTLLEMNQKQGRSERLERAKQELEELDEKLRGPRPRNRSRDKIQGRAEGILDRVNVRRYLHVQTWQEQIHQYRQEHRGRPGPDTRYRRKTKRRWRIRWELDQAAIDYDEKTDGMYPLLTNDKSLTSAQVLEAHKHQPSVEKRFEQLKTVHEIAPVLLKNEGRIEAFFFLYFVALLIQALIEREMRRCMEREGIEKLPIYPEERPCRRPTSQQILRLFALTEGHILFENGRVVQIFDPELTDLQKQVLKLLGVPRSAFSVGA